MLLEQAFQAGASLLLSADPAAFCTCLLLAVVGDPSPAVGSRASAARGSAARRSPSKAAKLAAAAADGPAALEGKFSAAAAVVGRGASEAAENDSANVAAVSAAPAAPRGSSKKKRAPLGVPVAASGPAFLQG